MTETDGPPDFRRFRKWSVLGVPHRGWTCIEIEDLGAPDAVCEMCERQDNRYTHAMQHPDCPEKLHCGCASSGSNTQPLSQFFCECHAALPQSALHLLRHGSHARPLSNNEIFTPVLSQHRFHFVQAIHGGAHLRLINFLRRLRLPDRAPKIH